MTPQEQKASMTILQGLAILDGLLTAASRLEAWIASKRMLGEMTPEEEAAHDAHKAKLFAEWNSATTATKT
jgi:hypothetical protein